uniref:NADH-ubiquinone oxidoreductase chain 6 n=1 Tax=Cymbiodyta marginella TaxID=347319 RepID=A0A343C2U2_9COLE|nr:NADH dehydrogenase subunit 6 [Cymbiodyta marginella]
MLMLMLNMSFMLSLFIIFSSHPLSMGVTLLSQVLIVSLITGMMASNFWFSYILFLIMVGGMLVLFVYMTSIASNEKFNYSSNLMKFFIMIIGLSMITLMMSDWLFIEYNNSQLENITNLNFNMTLNKFINYPYNILLFSLITYLFITLIAVVKISKIKYGPLRQMN